METLISVTAGILQGDILAPFLFIVVLDYVLRISFDNMNEKGRTPRKSNSYPSAHVTGADFADDLSFLADSQTHKIYSVA